MNYDYSHNMFIRIELLFDLLLAVVCKLIHLLLIIFLFAFNYYHIIVLVMKSEEMEKIVFSHRKERIMFLILQI